MRPARWSKVEHINDVLLWTPTHGCPCVGRPAITCIHQLCADTGCSLEDLPWMTWWNLTHFLFYFQKNKAIEELMEQLGEEFSVYEATIKTPVHKMVEALRTTDTSPSRYSRSEFHLSLNNFYIINCLLYLQSFDKNHFFQDFVFLQ